MANILVIKGSPRKNGNSSILAESFVSGARSKGHEVDIFDAGAKQIGGCRACEKCWSLDRGCVFKDGFTDLEPLLEKADTLVFVTPIYWYTMTSQLKAVIDRMYCYGKENCKNPLRIKKSYLLTCAAEETPEVFIPLINTYKKIIELMNWENGGVMAVGGVWDAGDINNSKELEKAFELGEKA